MARYVNVDDIYECLNEIEECDDKTYAISLLDWAIGKRTIAEDVKPVARGKWIHFSRGDQCSECGYDTGKYEEGRNFCPNCGADMRGE